MNVLGLCSGAGGLELGVRIARPDARCVAMVEREAHAAAILVARMEDKSLDPAPVWTDIGTFDGRPWRGVVDCIISGDPCQPFSVAGQQSGTDDTRWLGEHVIRIIDQVRPSRVFRENVPGGAAEQLAFFVPALERMGYRVAAGIFSAEEVGASHRRERLFIMADRADKRHALGPADGRQLQDKQRSEIRSELGRHGREMAHSPRLQRGTVQRGEPDGAGGGVGNAANQRHERTGETRGRRAGSANGNDKLADPGGPRLPQRPRTEIGPGTVRHEGRTAAPGGDLPLFAPGPTDPRWPDIIAAFPHLEPAVRRMADGMAGRVDRLRACGNGVFPMAAAFAWCALSDALAGAEADEPVLMEVAE